MNDSMQEIAKKMVAPRKGILAADTSIKSSNKRLAAIGVEGTPETRRQFRDLSLSTPGIEQYLNAVILFDETVRQSNNDGINFVDLLIGKGIIPGIKVDEGLTDLPNFPGEQITRGLDDLPARLTEYREMGLKFAKWRAVTHITDSLPTLASVTANNFILAQYAAYCQQADIVPMVEPEVLLDGDHSMEKAEEVTTGVLTDLFRELEKYRVDLSAVILKTSMVIPGGDSKQEVSHEQIAEATVRVLINSVPEEVPGVVFLSGGQSPDEATFNLDAIADLEPLPWEIAFSFDRAIQQEALEVWHGKPENVDAARKALIRRLKLEVKADMGEL